MRTAAAATATRDTRCARQRGQCGRFPCLRAATAGDLAHRCRAGLVSGDLPRACERPEPQFDQFLLAYDAAQQLPVPDSPLEEVLRQYPVCRS